MIISNSLSSYTKYLFYCFSKERIGSYFRNSTNLREIPDFFRSNFLLIYPSTMEGNIKNKDDVTIEDEKQFTDLLFGDLEEIPLSVIYL